MHSSRVSNMEAVVWLTVYCLDVIDERSMLLQVKRATLLPAWVPKVVSGK